MQKVAISRCAALAVLTMLALSDPAAGQAGTAKLPPQVQRELMSMVKACRDAGGKPGKSPSLLVIVDLTGDRVADFVIDQSAFNCEGAASLFSGTGGSELIIYAGAGHGKAVKVFEHGVMEVKVDKTASPASVKVAVGGVFCGQRSSQSLVRSDLQACWRSLEWSASKNRVEFAPLSRVEPYK